MYKQNRLQATSLRVNNSFEGETIEKKLRRIENNKEPITDGAPIMYTERKDGVRAETNIRSDRWDIAIDAMDHVSQSHKAKRENRLKNIGEQAQEGMKKEDDGKAKPTQATE